MLLHEKLRLTRKISKLTLRQLKASSRKERMTKQIERVQKMYSKRESWLDRQAQMLQTQASLFFKNMAGIGTQNQLFSPMSYMSGTAGMTTAAAQWMNAWKGEGAKWTKDGEECSLSPERAQELWKGYMSGQLKPNDSKDGYLLNGKDSVSTEEFQALQAAMQLANQQVGMRQMYCQQMTADYQQNISIWLEAQKEQLELEQDAALAPLQEQEDEWDLEAQSCETQLADARARLDGIKQALSEGIKDSAPTFGLG